MFPDTERWTVDSLKLVAGFFGVARETVSEWVKKGMPGSEKEFRLDKIAQWLRVEIYPRTPAVGDSKKADLEIRKLRAETEMREIKTALQRGQLVERVAVLAANEEMFGTIRTRLEAIPEEVGSSVPPDLRQELVADWRNKVHLVLKELAAFADEELAT